MNQRFLLSAALFLVVTLVSAIAQEKRELRFEDDPNPPFSLPTEGGLVQVVFSPDGRYVATFTDIAAKIWECATGKIIYRSSGSRYDGQLNWKGSGGISIEFVNNTTVIDSRQLIVDLENNIGEPVRDWNKDKARFYPLDADHGFVLSSDNISLINRSEKATLWDFNLWKIKARNSAPWFMPSNIGIDRERGRIVFAWGDDDAHVSSLSFEGTDYKDEVRVLPTTEKVYGGYKRTILPKVQISTDGKRAILFNSSGGVPQKVQLLTIGSGKKPLTLGEISKVKPPRPDMLQGNWLGFSPAGDIDFFNQQDGQMVALLFDGVTGKLKDQVHIAETKSIGHRVVNYSPDRKMAAVVRMTNKATSGVSIGLYDAISGKHLRSFDDTEQSIALSQSEQALYERSKAAREAAEEAQRAARAARTEAEHQMAQAERARYISNTRPCSACKEKGSYTVKGEIVTWVDAIPLEPYYDYKNGKKYVFGVPLTKYKQVTTIGDVSYLCPSCQGKGRVAK